MSAPDIFALARVVMSNSLIECTDADTGIHYVAEAPPRSDPDAAVWKCSAVFPLSNGGRRIKHAVALHAPGVEGENLSTLTYA